MELTLEILFAILIFVGVLLSLIPTLPAVPAIFLMTLLYGFITKFDELKPWHIVVFAGIAILSVLIDYFSGLIGAKLGGASKKSLLFGVIGLVIGLIIFPPFGAFLGLFVGVFIAELVQFKDHIKALRAASFSLAATVAGAVTNIFLAIGLLVAFLIIVF